MNNKVGLKDMFEHKEALTLMARSLNPNLPHVMQVRIVLNILKICVSKMLLKLPKIFDSISIKL